MTKISEAKIEFLEQRGQSQTTYEARAEIEFTHTMLCKEEFDRRSNLFELCRVVTKISEAKIGDEE